MFDGEVLSYGLVKQSQHQGGGARLVCGSGAWDLAIYSVQCPVAYKYICCMLLASSVQG